MPEPSRHHREVASQKRVAILRAATADFAAAGFERATLAAVARTARVSRATLFKQFPTKAALFEALVADFWEGALEPVEPSGGLLVIGHRYAGLLTRPGMADLSRVVIAQAQRFPDLGRTLFERGRSQFWRSVREHLVAEAAVGNVVLDDPDLAATQFLGMIDESVFWPKMMLPEWRTPPEEVERVVREAAATLLARYAR